jgi:hypothetical protein
MQRQTRARGGQIVFWSHCIWLVRTRRRAGNLKIHQSGCEGFIQPRPPTRPRNLQRIQPSEAISERAFPAQNTQGRCPEPIRGPREHRYLAGPDRRRAEAVSRRSHFAGFTFLQPRPPRNTPYSERSSHFQNGAPPLAKAMHLIDCLSDCYCAQCAPTQKPDTVK